MTDRSLQPIIRQCKRLVSDPSARSGYLRSIRRQGREIIGYFSNYIPEEIIAAAGFHPLRIIGPMAESPRATMYNPVCSFVQDMYAAAESGAFSDFNRVIFPHSCDSLKVFRLLWQANAFHPPAEVLLHPIRFDCGAVDYFAEQIRKLAQALAPDFSDVPLAETIDCYNQTRRMLRTLYAFCEKNPAAMKGSERIALVTAAMIMDRRQYNQLLEQVLAELDSAPPAGPVKRILILGPLVDNLLLLEAIEQAGAVIAADEMTNGSRYFDREVECAGDPYENLAARYLLSGPSPTFSTEVESDLQAFRVRLEAWRPDGVICINQKYCEPHIHHYLEKCAVLKEFNIRHMMLEVEHDHPGVSERDRLRIESLIQLAD